MNVLWPWCFLLVFTHAFLVDNHEVLFIFIEWGLPIVCGFFLLFEHLWNFGSYFFIYLNGGRGRRSLVITLIEDVLTFFIVIIRVSLQVVRGLLCGFFHNFFRELNDMAIDLYHLYVQYTDWSIPFLTSASPFMDFIFFCAKWYLIGFLLLFTYAIMFLQLLFLVIAVWLFCRCWFISSGELLYTETTHFDYMWNKKAMNTFDFYDCRRDENLKSCIKRYYV